MKSPKETPPAATEGAHNNATASDELSASRSEEHAANRPSVSLPPHPPGLLGDLSSYFYASARYPMYEGALLAALGLMAGVAGRAFNFEGTGLNLYLLLLAESGRGKEDMARGIERILGAIRGQCSFADDFVGPRKFASGQALNRALASNPCFLSIQSEFGLRLKELNDPRAPASTSELRLSLLDLYAKSGKNDTFRATAYADREKNTQVVKAPALSILGESTPGHVLDNLTFRDIEDGLLPRTLLIECAGDRPATNPNAYAPPHEQLVNRFADLVATVMQLGGANPNPMEPRQIGLSSEAKAALEAIQGKFDADFNDKSRTAHDRALWNRAGLNIRRIAALIAVGCMQGQHSVPTIEYSHVEWAYRFVALCVEGLARRFRDGLVGTGEARLEGELRKYLTDYYRMTPFKRCDTYRVPKKIMHEGYVVPYGYFRKRASQCKAFTDNPRRDFSVVLGAALDGLCKSGVLLRIEAEYADKRFGVRQELYAMGSPEEWGLKPRGDR